jgi:hypothetical protein
MAYKFLETDRGRLEDLNAGRGKCPDKHQHLPSLLFNGYWGSFPEDKAAWALT